MTKILCMIDALGPGGAERQMTGLASMLHNEGHLVAVAYHEPKHFFAEQIKANGIEVSYLASAANPQKRIFEYRKFIKQYKPDVVIAYLQSACIVACLIKASGLNFKLIVSERNTNTSKNWRDYVRFNLYRFADYVVPNSFSQEKFIYDNFKFLKKKVKTIINFVDTQKFVPGKPHERMNNILVAATIWPSKNTLGFIRALGILKERGLQFHVKWFGKVEDQSEYTKQCEILIEELELKDYIELLEKTPNILEEYQKADFFCLPSFYEGTPNAICEAMSCGLPIICSNVCDNARFVRNNENGILFDPNSILDMANKIEEIISLSNENIKQFSHNSHNKSRILFSPQIFILNYISLFK